MLELAGSDPVEIAVELPYMDQREWRKRGEILAALPLERRGNIDFRSAFPRRCDAQHRREPRADRSGLEERAQGRRSAVFCAPGEGSRCGATAIPARPGSPSSIFSDISRFEDRDTAFPMLVYQAARVCRGQSRGDFTYDLPDYPACRITLALALKMTGLSLQSILAGIEQRLETSRDAGAGSALRPRLVSGRYPGSASTAQSFLALLTDESAFINGWWNWA